MRTRPLAVALGFLVFAGGLEAEVADLGPYVERLRSIGLDTTYVERLISDLTAEWMEPDPDGPGEAQWRFVANVLEIPPHLREPKGNKIRFDIDPSGIATVTHELCHAAYDFYAEKGSALMADRSHAAAVAAIEADLKADPRHRRFGIPQFVTMKADEVSSEFQGKAIAELFRLVGILVGENTRGSVSKASSEEEARELGGTFLAPRFERGKSKDMDALMTPLFKLGQISVAGTAYFKGSELIGWDETGKGQLKHVMYHGMLGLSPPPNVAKLLEALNDPANDHQWLLKTREDIRAARLRSAAGRAASEVAGDETHGR